MKTLIFLACTLFTGTFIASVAFANPALLPQHPGYPMGKAVDPVRGLSLANDPGQLNAGGGSTFRKSAVISDNNLSQQLSPSDQEKLHEEAATDLKSKEPDPKTERR